VIGRGRIQWIGECGYVFRERVEGESKVSAKLYVEYLRHLLRLRLAGLPMARFVRFALVGFSGVFVDMGVLYLLSDPSMLGMGLTRSKAIAAELAIINNFLWNDAWTFRDKVGTQTGIGHKLRRLIKFNLVCGIGLVLNIVLLNLMFNYLRMDRYLANGLAIAIVTGWNFWLNVKLSWRDSGAEVAASKAPAAEAQPLAK
jgi:dolichol-phosphate mannosyltransferase